MRHFLLSLLILLLVGCGDEATPTPAVSPPSTPAAPLVTPPPAGAPPPSIAATLPAEVAASSPPTAEPTVTVPGATLTSASGATQEAIIGSYCFAGLCVTDDLVALSVPAEPLPVVSGEALTFTLSHGAPQFTTLRVLAWQPAEGTSGTLGTAAQSLDAPLLASGDLEPSATPRWEAPPTPGDYVLDMNTVYANGDSIAYTWRIVVGP